jgi:manganese-dependent inorganic pyrophosphatase
MVAAAHPDVMKKHIEKDDLIIVADREEDHLNAIEMGASCIILCLDSPVTDRVLKMAQEYQCVVITSPLDTFNVARLINQSIPVRYIMKKNNLITFHTEDYTDQIKDVMVKNRHRAFPVISKRGKCLGTISRRNFLGMRKKQLILVDHNERNQAVDNIEDAEVLEIIDHHRLGNLETIQPVLFRNEPVGCTATIMYKIYQEERLDITPQIAGLLCAAIISDTLMFRSPTCTLADKMAAGALALIAGIDIEKFASEMFRAGSNLKSKSAEEIFYQDFKKFMTDSVTFGVGQITSMSGEELSEVKERMLPFMKNECGRSGVSQVYFMLTNIMEESTELLYYGDDSERMASEGFDVEAKDGHCFLPGVVSRKKQLIPALIEASQDVG